MIFILSDGHSDGYYSSRRVPVLKDVAGHDLYLNDPVWFANDNGDFVAGNLIEVIEDSATVMTRSSSLISIYFKIKSGIPSCNQILRG